MQSLLLKLEADIAARKRPSSLRRGTIARLGFVALLVTLSFQLGTKRAGERIMLGSSSTDAALLEQFQEQQGEIDLQRAYIERLEHIQKLSARYGIGADLAALIEDIALAEGIDPRLAFELVRVESGFKQRAVSPVGALGLTQLMPATAEWMQPGITRQQIFDRETNLRLGFRFFHILLKEYKGNVRLALLAYNRGPATVNRLLAQGVDPGNGYAKLIMSRSKRR